MDSLITAAARALAAGDPLGALNCVALRDDAAAVALRGIAMAQIGDFDQARALLRRAARAFGSKESLARARCILAEAEVALVSRDLAWPEKALERARMTLERHGDLPNAAHARLIGIRSLFLTGRIDDAERALARLDPEPLAPSLEAAHELLLAGVAIRRLRVSEARAALARAQLAAARARIPALIVEVENASAALDTPAALLRMRGRRQSLLLDEVAQLLQSDVLVVDALRRGLRQADRVVSLATRPVLFTLLRELANAWPDDAPRDHLIARAFRTRRADDSHRARLRVEIGRLRAAIRGLADVVATDRGFLLQPRRTSEVALLSPPIEDRHAAVLALLADGEAWSSSAIALALGASQRAVQRALNTLAAEGKAQPCGRGRARRWTAPPVPGFATHLLLPTVLPSN
jgi:tetratricopeptide (TPR) repeat protein